METIGLYVSVPVASFRVPRAREYFETFPIPPPATVYGMLLSMIGEVNRRVYEGAEIAIALLSEPEYSVILRTLWRVKNKHSGLGLSENRRPDFQELLTSVRLAFWIRDEETAKNSLTKRIQMSFENPSIVNRFGGLCLGESTYLVDEVKLLKEIPEDVCQFLLNDDDGDLSLPIWADHVGSSTTWGQYSLQEVELNQSIPERAWTKIKRNPILPIIGQINKTQANLFD
ncbi:MAG: type I-MYXAN CRISPR-associated protein Cas5/Cmx5/DevS [Pyrinomonadaceae bacterium]|nr:type I-MYXAN CRISPR-associated protein Cas5/Cmx5/DevS [Pyrinomonadaceae bacterium]